MKKTGLIITLLLTLTLMLSITACSDNVSSISIKTLPKTNYILNEQLNVDGGELYANSKGGQQVVAMTNKDVKLSGYNSSALGGQTVTVEYGGQSTTYNVTVREVESISLQRTPYVLDYAKNSTMNLAGGLLRVSFKNGDLLSVPMTDPAIMVSYSTSQVGTVPVTVSYGGKTSSFQITIHETATSATLVNQPQRVNFFVGESSDLTGAMVEVNFTGSVQNFVLTKGHSVPNFDTSTKGDKTASFEFLGISLSFEYTVWEIESVTIARSPNKLYFSSLETISLAGGILKVDAKDSEYFENVSMNDERVTHSNLDYTLHDVEQDITVSFLGVEAQTKLKLKVTAELDNLAGYLPTLGTISTNWGSVMPTYTTTQVNAALSAFAIYSSMPQTQREEFSQYESLIVSSAFSVEYVKHYTIINEMNIWSYGMTWYYVYGIADVSPFELEKMPQARAINSQLPSMASDLWAKFDGFKSTQLTASITILNLLNYFDLLAQNFTAEFITPIEYALNIFTGFETIPQGILENENLLKTLPQYNSIIGAAHQKIISITDYAYANFMCYIISFWRDDFMSIIYEYLYNNGGSSLANNTALLAMLESYDEFTITPMLLQLIYAYYDSASAIANFNTRELFICAYRMRVVANQLNKRVSKAEKLIFNNYVVDYDDTLETNITLASALAGYSTNLDIQVQYITEEVTTMINTYQLNYTVTAFFEFFEEFNRISYRMVEEWAWNKTYAPFMREFRDDYAKVIPMYIQLPEVIKWYLDYVSLLGYNWFSTFIWFYFEYSVDGVMMVDDTEYEMWDSYTSYAHYSYITSINPNNPVSMEGYVTYMYNAIKFYEQHKDEIDDYYLLMFYNHYYSFFFDLYVNSIIVTSNIRSARNALSEVLLNLDTLTDEEFITRYENYIALYNGMMQVDKDALLYTIGEYNRGLLTQAQNKYSILVG